MSCWRGVARLPVNQAAIAKETHMTTTSPRSIHFAFAASSLGAIGVARSPKGVCAIALADDRRDMLRDLQQQFPDSELIEDAGALANTMAQVVRFVESPAAGIDLPLDVGGTAFQQRVWRALRKIPRGTTASYADIARRIDQPKSVRAVAQACGANLLALAIPCHRVVRSDGALSGYRWGAARKRALLEREAAR
jgi:AraC family transcriptional regulator, regulatory protein of adaptative response / methylated-DNA-[protein]-cysteine methyltransferase